MNAIARRVAQARQAIVQAALTAGRDPGEVTLVAATKTQTDVVSYTHLTLPTTSRV